MKAINNYKLFIEELHFIFSIFEECNKDECLEYCSISLLKKQEAKTMHYANRIAGEIKEELIGDGKEAEFKGRLKTAFWELTEGSNTRDYYFPSFESPNNSRVQTLSVIYGDEAADVIEVVKTISQLANYMVQNVCNMFDEMCKFVGYTPDHQHEKEIESFFTDELKTNKKAMTILQNAVDRKLIEFDVEHLIFKGSNALLAYMCGIAFCDDTKRFDTLQQIYKVKRGSGYFPDAFLSELFRVKNLGQSRLQLDSVPRGYEKVDKCL